MFTTFNILLIPIVSNFKFIDAGGAALVLDLSAGELVQIYDTLQESIDAMVTTPPSAILRQGSDTSSNDPRINIPRTPENLI